MRANIIKDEPAPAHPLRTQVRPSDIAAVKRLVSETEFFSAEELGIAMELVEETLEFGAASGYSFLFIDDEQNTGQIMAYSCYGAIPAQPTCFDLYWIAVPPRHQGQGLGRQLLVETENRVIAAGASQLFIETSGRELYKPTRGFYEANGYICKEIVKDYYGKEDDKVVYVKSFPSILSKLKN